MSRHLCIALAKRNYEIPEMLAEVSSTLKLSKADTFAYILRQYQDTQNQEKRENV
jgi:hypothetical protein